MIREQGDNSLFKTKEQCTTLKQDIDNFELQLLQMFSRVQEQKIFFCKLA